MCFLVTGGQGSSRPIAPPVKGLRGWDDSDPNHLVVVWGGGRGGIPSGFGGSLLEANLLPNGPLARQRVRGLPGIGFLRTAGHRGSKESEPERPALTRGAYKYPGKPPKLRSKTAGSDQVADTQVHTPFVGSLPVKTPQ